MLMQLKDYHQHAAASSLADIATPKPKDLNCPSVSSSAKRMGHVNGSVGSHAEDSSSDEELREPVEDQLPNLSDNESFETLCVSPTMLRKHDMDQKEAFTSRFSQLPAGKENQAVAATATSPSSSCFGNQHGDELLPVNILCEENKKYSFRRRTGRKTKSFSSEELNEKLQQGCSGVGDSGKVLLPSVIKLPYVSRTIREPYGGASLKSSITKEAVKETKEKNVPLTTSSFSSDISSSAILEDRPGIKNGIEEQVNSLQNRTLHCRGGCSSLGSRSDSDSFSSASNASLSLSTVSRPVSSDKDLYSFSSTKGRSEPQTISEDVFLDKLAPTPSPIATTPGPNIENRDVSSSTFTTSSSKRTEKNVLNSKLSNFKYQSVSVSSQANPLPPSSENAPEDISRHLDQLKTRTQLISNEKANRGENYNNNNSLTGVNSISMIEHFQVSSAANGVKMRFSSASKRSKKSVASRNSRAFALQAKQIDEENSSELSATMTNDSSNRPRSKRSENNKQIVSSDARRRAASLSPNNFASEQLAGCRREISASLANLHCENSSDKFVNASRGAGGRRLSETPHPTFFQDEYSVNLQLSTARNNSNHRSGHNSSAWSLSYESSHNQRIRTQRRPSFQDRLKGAFSFQNIRKAISMERLEENERLRLSTSSYLNEYGEGITQAPQSKSNRHNDAARSSNLLRKAASITSIFSTVRMRKRKSRERRATQLRNTIGVDPKQIPEYECISEFTEQPEESFNNVGDVGTPAHFRPIGRVLQMNVNQGTMLIEMTKPHAGPFGFFLARNKENGGVYISSMGDSYPDKMYSGLMKLGDEITEINGKAVDKLSLDDIYGNIQDHSRIVLKIKPARVHAV